MNKENKNKKIVGLVLCAVILAVVSFYAGMRYGGNNVQAAINSRGQNFGQYGGMNGGMNGGMRGMRSGGGFVNGEILSKDAQSITVKTQDGGSKIVFYTDKTTVMKTVEGAVSDLVVGVKVAIIGVANSDGSVNANSVQIRNSQQASSQ
ncbi:MAG: hypothetical protein V4439_00535 [Patescibacteria group bacterium]